MAERLIITEYSGAHGDRVGRATTLEGALRAAIIRLVHNEYNVFETPVKEPPVVKPDAPTPDDEPERIEPLYKCTNCPATSSDSEDLCYPMRLA